MLRVLRAASLAMGNILQLDHISNIIDKHVGNVEKMLKQLDHFLTEVYSTVVVVRGYPHFTILLAFTAAQCADTGRVFLQKILFSIPRTSL